MVQLRSVFVLIVLALVSIFSTACSPAVATPSAADIQQAINATQAAAASTATMNAQVSLAIQATQTAAVAQPTYPPGVLANLTTVSLPKTLTYPGLLTLSYPNDWQENALPRNGQPANAGTVSGTSFFVEVVKGEERSITVQSIGTDPTKVVEAMISGSGPVNATGILSYTIGDNPAARAEMDFATGPSEFNGRLELIVIFSVKTNSYILVFIGAQDKTHWNELQPVLEAMIPTIKLVN